MTRMSEPPGAPRAKQSLTDSPWFWAMIFSATGVVLLLIISPKYAKRQGRLELQYQARQEIARRRVEGTPAARDPGQEGSAAPPAAGELIIPLWPLVDVFVAGFVIAATFLYRSRRQQGGPPNAPDPRARPS